MTFLILPVSTDTKLSLSYRIQSKQQVCLMLINVEKGTEYNISSSLARLCYVCIILVLSSNMNKTTRNKMRQNLIVVMKKS